MVATYDNNVIWAAEIEDRLEWSSFGMFKLLLRKYGIERQYALMRTKHRQFGLRADGLKLVMLVMDREPVEMYFDPDDRVGFILTQPSYLVCNNSQVGKWRHAFDVVKGRP